MRGPSPASPCRRSDSDPVYLRRAMPACAPRAPGNAEGGVRLGWLGTPLSFRRQAEHEANMQHMMTEKERISAAVTVSREREHRDTINAINANHLCAPFAVPRRLAKASWGCNDDPLSRYALDRLVSSAVRALVVSGLISLNRAT